ncbi:hypothetical protein H5T57_01755 [Candidatus Bipolaricaulota bacterium]|nr:hypothetical protein [Candidatus Bipolaricaulota bacterium]
MRGLLALLLAFGLSAQAVPLGLESGPHFFRTYPPALSAFIQLTNQAIAYGNQTFFGDIPAVPLLSGGVGVRMAETLGEPFSFGLGFSLFGAETGTEGAWGDQEVKVQLGLSYADLHALFVFSPIPGMIFLGASAGLAWASLSYSVTFPSLTLSFVPASGEGVYRGRAFCAAFFLRAALPVFPNLTVGAEAGFRFAFFPGLFSEDGGSMDLNRDGNPDPLDLSGFWLGVSLRVELPL